ncbi:MAG TPA: hypothetical protein VGA68_04530, partial [Woeseiaceae bacterium]
ILRYATYFSKDLLFFYAGYLGLRRGSLIDVRWLYVCAALIIVPSMGATLMSSNPVGVFLSLRAYLLMPACAYLAASLIRDFRDVERCALLVAVSAMGVAVLSTYQYALPATHWLNRYDSGVEETHIVATAGHVRATGTFAYISGMAMLAGVSGWAGTFLALPLPGRSQWVRVVGLGALVAGFVCSATSMSRGALMFWSVSIIGGCLLYFRPKQILAFLFALLVISPFLTSSGEQVSGDAVSRPDSLTSGLTYRLSQEDVFQDRAAYVLMNLILGVSNHPLGEGMGVGQPGGKYAASDQSFSYESEWGRIAFEIGPIGLAAVLFMRFATCQRCWRQLSVATDDRLRLVLATSLPYFGIMSLGWMAFNHTGNSFAWSVIALSLGAAYGYGRDEGKVSARAIYVPSGPTFIHSTCATGRNVK